MDVKEAAMVADRAIRSVSFDSVPAIPRNFYVFFDCPTGTVPRGGRA
jgi:hypothetical protein